MPNMELVLLGTGSPMPSANRCGGGQVVVGGAHRVLVDCGWGVARRIFAAGMLPAMIDTLCFTHMHSDHITDTADFIIMRWTGGAKTPLKVYGPEGTRETMDGFMAALRLDIGYRLAHHGEKLSTEGAKVEVREIPATPQPAPVVTLDGMAIEAFEVDHFPVVPALGFRIRRNGAALVISGDTNICDSLAQASEDADLLVCEAMNRDLLSGFIRAVRANGREDTAGLLEDAMTYHSGTNEIAKMARTARVKRLILSHLIPAIPDEGPAVAQFVAGMSDVYQGEIIVGRDLQHFEV
jgi:ribonuclease Z